MFIVKLDYHDMDGDFRIMVHSSYPNIYPNRNNYASIPNSPFNNTQIMFQHELQITQFIKGTPYIHGLFPGFSINKTKFYSYVNYYTEKENV